MAETLWYLLAEASKATRIPRGRLDHACRVGRLPYRRSETGARLLAQSTIDKLRKQGLAAFPRPYDPIAVAPPEEAAKQPDRPGPAERIGLLAEPSPEIVKVKEQAEAARFRAEAAEATAREQRERAKLSDFWRERQRARQAEIEAEREVEAERRREEAAVRRELEHQRAEQRRREEWAARELRLALDECTADFGFLGPVPTSKAQEAKQAIAENLVEEWTARSIGPDSLSSACQRARSRAIDRALHLYRWAALRKKLFENPWRSEIEDYLDGLHRDGYISLEYSDRRFLAGRIKPRVIAATENEFSKRSGRVTEEEARQVVHEAIDRELKLA